MESRLLQILVCPLCKGPLRVDRGRQELVCGADKLAFPIRDGIPVMLESEARKLTASRPSDGSPGQADAWGAAPGSSSESENSGTEDRQ